MLSVKKIRVGKLKANSYVVGTQEECILIDPGSDKAEDLKLTKEAIGERTLRAIIITHAHFDHIDGAHYFFETPVYIHPKDLLTVKTQKILSKTFIGKTLILPEKILELKDEMRFGDIHFKVLHTPGHTKGGVCLLFDQFIFTGDTLFQGTYGRTDVGGNKEDMLASLQKLAQLDETLVVYPEHGRSTTIAKEKSWIKNVQIGL